MTVLQTSRPKISLINPQWLEALFSGRRAAYLWLAVRVYIGVQWLWAGSHKLFGATSIGWIRDGFAGGKAVHHGDKLLAFWQQAAAAPTSSTPQVAYPWYRAFLTLLIQHQLQTHFVYLIAFGETLIGIALIFGLFTALASVSAATLNFNYMLAGSASLNPVLFLGELLLLVAWRRAGSVGIDGWLIPALSSRLRPERLIRRERAPSPRLIPAPLFFGPAPHASRREVAVVARR